MKKLAYCPINNRSLRIPEEGLSEFTEAVLDACKVRKSKPEDYPDLTVHVLFVLSEPSPAVDRAIKKFPKWITGEVIVQRTFSQALADKEAKRRFDQSDTICFRIIPEGILSEGERKRMVEKIRYEFGGAFVFTMPNKLAKEESKAMQGKGRDEEPPPMEIELAL